MTKIAVKAVTVSLLSLSFAAHAGEAQCDYKHDWLSSACERVMRVAHDGTWDLYVTGYGWHIDGYTNRSELNPWSWGGGAGKHWVDANGNEDLLFAMAFSDSHHNVEPIVGYARQWYTNPVLGGLQVGGGFFAGFTARSDVAHYLPLPLAFPVASVRYRRTSFLGTFIPRIPGLNDGDVAFFFGRYEF
ncbi:antimicrobial peptide resistance and lipid A acylation PagP [Caballeronia grimmiae]|uniref:Lipid A palmitoyltransferase PagP n=1 Tax=Caballeronia grimmiae TaxID=1071679 RepID=A0A069PGW4_9BURK|nr:antimicrobial peptide resistance and lipid A acylation PagP [Caballeronia grimmiae]KDR36571.1 phospholipid:lipid A palmitoyltransferase [Caballeronia grimmiae]GGD54802.1 lipid A palmitoyltransferase PagP [Caballeronia grimmiae]